MIPLFANNGTSTAAVAILSTDTIINVASAAQFPVPAAGQYFMATLEDRTQTPAVLEIVQVIGVAGTSLTVVRAQEGTAAQAFPVGATVSNRLTAGVLAQLAAAGPSVNSLYIGAYASAPTNAPDGTALITGMLYFNTTTGQLYEYSAAATWVPVSANGTFGSGALYLGKFSTAPTTRNDGTPLQAGDSYFNTVSNSLYVWSGTAWEVAADVNNIFGDTTIHGNLTVTQNAGVTGGLTVDQNIVCDQTVKTQDLNVTGTLTLDGLPVVPADALSGTSNSQNFPDGTMMMWGSATTGEPLVFPEGGFPTTCDVITGVIIGNDAGDDPGCILSFNSVNKLGCNVKGFRPTDGTEVTGRTVNWIAIGA